MKRKIMAVLGLFLMFALLLTGCSKKPAETAETVETTTEAAVKTVDSPYELNMKDFDSLIKSLPDGGYYAFAAMDKDHDALLVTDEVYKEGNKLLATRADVYAFNKNKEILEFGSVASSDSGYPLATKDDYLYFGGKDRMTKVTVEEARNAMTIVAREEAGKGDSAKLDALFTEYHAAIPVEFTAVEGSSIPGPKSYAGTWAEKTSERVVMAIEPTGEAGWFDVTITWREALPQKDLYTMRAHYQKDGSLYYDNCRYLVRTFDDNAKFTDEVKYTNGSGLINYDKDAKVIYWTDYKKSKSENVQTFIKADNYKIETVTAKSTTRTTTKSTTKATTKKGETTKKATTKKVTEEDGQNPVMNFIGRYGSGRATMDVECQGKKGAHFHVYWSSSAAEHSEWTMSGEFDSSNNSVYYTNCVKKTIIYNDEGNVEVETVEYVGGKGSVFFKGSSLTWEDLAEHIADGMTFTM